MDCLKVRQTYPVFSAIFDLTKKMTDITTRFRAKVAVQEFVPIGRQIDIHIDVVIYIFACPGCVATSFDLFFDKIVVGKASEQHLTAPGRYRNVVAVQCSPIQRLQAIGERRNDLLFEFGHADEARIGGKIRAGHPYAAIKSRLLIKPGDEL